jgi:hypothetical protein
MVIGKVNYDLGLSVTDIRLHLLPDACLRFLTLLPTTPNKNVLVDQLTNVRILSVLLVAD